LALRHGPSRSESMPVENAHHLEPDSPNRFARKPPGGTGRASTADAPEGTAGRDLPGAKPVGRLAVGGREPPCLKRRPASNAAQWPLAVGGLSASAGQGRSRSIRRSSTTVSPPTTIRRRLHRERLLQNSTEANNPSRPPTIRMIPTVLSEPGGLDLHGKGQDGADNEQEDAEADAHRHASSDTAVVWSWLLSAGGAVL
jgi:hypothetical protein